MAIISMSGPLSMFNYFAIRVALGFLLICGEDRWAGAPGSPEIRVPWDCPWDCPQAFPKHSKTKQSKVKQSRGSSSMLPQSQAKQSKANQSEAKQSPA